MRPRRPRACFLNLDPKFVNLPKLKLEQALKAMVDIDLVEVSAMDDPKFLPCDLLILESQGVPEENFQQWLTGFQRRLVAQADIWIPAVIVADLPVARARSMMEDAVKSNWYFDVVTPAHIDSLPLRVANLLRIHDHLHELRRYSETLDRLQDRVNMLEHEVNSLRAGPPPR
ncbi:MAG: hypothetical protein RIQ81_1855 [Pseudomonadota bacterium]|jgi:hypothetical protein